MAGCEIGKIPLASSHGWARDEQHNSAIDSCDWRKTGAGRSSRGRHKRWQREVPCLLSYMAGVPCGVPERGPMTRVTRNNPSLYLSFLAAVVLMASLAA